MIIQTVTGLRTANRATVQFLMNPSQENPREYQRKAIDAQIRSLEESLRNLRRRRNALAPISSLPPELFTAIFSILRLPPSDTVLLGGEPDRHLSWLNVAHVCHEWRELALNQPFFWSHVDFTTLTPAGATEMLVRAKSVPLYLGAWFPKYEYGYYERDKARISTFQKELQPRVSHISQLAISARPFNLERVLEGLVSPAPILQYLSLSGKKYRRRIDGQPFVPVPVTLFNGSTPRLSRLELKYCDISWKSPLFRSLNHLKITRLSADARPRLSFWLDALDEIPQLKTLVLHSASPITPAFPFDVKRTVTLPSLTYFDISASPDDCGLALAHLVLPALTSLCVTAFSSVRDGGDVERMLPYVGQHAHGPQDTWPLQSVLTHGYSKRVNILAWPVPDIDVEVDDPPTLLAATLSPRVTLYITSNVWYKSEIEILDAALAALPLDGLVMLTTEHLESSLGSNYDPRMVHFWLQCAPRWPLLRRIRVGISTVWGFIKMLLEEIGGDESPLLPSLTELVVVHASVDDHWTNHLCDALMRRVEQGVPLEVLDLRMCFLRFPAAVPLLSEIVVEVLGPMMETRDPGNVLGSGPVEEATSEYERISNLWDPIIRGLEDDNSGAEDDSDTDDSLADLHVYDETYYALSVNASPSFENVGTQSYIRSWSRSHFTALELRTTMTSMLRARPPVFSSLSLYSQFPELPSVKLVPQLRELTEVSIAKAREVLAASDDMSAALVWPQNDFVISVV
ncbi:hypothetical protein EDB92DRAFT_2118864 [Lactarius akahatsu]|uniref:F-box domain-containing protein n=1 Tax=Lactarius akahatsu TaxID=416441 RepID=A0AAD4L5T1_9AGAM|nr:hypothetical protein EDB92DRAFT_2118864 [Lactarius akahatsu]